MGAIGTNVLERSLRRRTDFLTFRLGLIGIDGWVVLYGPGITKSNLWPLYAVWKAGSADYQKPDFLVIV